MSEAKVMSVGEDRPRKVRVTMEYDDIKRVVEGDGVVCSVTHGSNTDVSLVGKHIDVLVSALMAMDEIISSLESLEKKAFVKSLLDLIEKGVTDD